MSELVLPVPGDKSITHRALLLAAVADGESVIERPLVSADTRSTMAVLRGLGVDVEGPDAAGTIRIHGTGGRLRAPTAHLDCGNSGTTARLILGVLAGAGLAAVVTGDASLRRRPVRRVTDPLRAMGARFAEPPGDGFPVEILGGTLHAHAHTTPVASAQIKSAILLAGLVSGVPVDVREPGASRDHTERLFAALGQPVSWESGRATLGPSVPVPRFRHVIPGDPSSAAFLLGAALLRGMSCRVTGVGLNPTRLGFVSVLQRMGADVQVQPAGEVMGEPVGDIVLRPFPLVSVTVASGEVPSVIDEIPLLAVLAARADGISRFEGVGELRVKESDRLELLRRNLEAVGGRARVDGDVLIVQGPGPTRMAGHVDTAGDHRLAMAFAVLGGGPGAQITLSEDESPDISFPGFAEALASVIGAPI